MARLFAPLAGFLLLLATTSARGDPPAVHATDTVAVQLLGFNDFHGNLTSARFVQQRPVGGAAVLASYLRDEAARFPGTTLIVHAGDQVGASPPASGLLADEPSIEFLNRLGNRFCSVATRMHPRCNLVGTLGNHEFDEGARELVRLLRGGRAAHAPFLGRPYRGTTFPYVSANVVDAQSGRPLLAPFVIKQADGVRIGVIGAVLRATPTMVVAGGVRALRFLDEVTAINEAVRTLRRRGIETIVVTIHQGGRQPPYEGPTRRDVPRPDGEIAALVAQLDDAVDVVVSGHAHAFTNALIDTPSGHAILVTQAFSAGSAYADIELTVDRASGDVREKSARIVTTFADSGPGLTPAADVAALVRAAEDAVRSTTERLVGRASAPISDAPNPAGESALGNLIADAQRAAVGADVALMNTGGIRTSLAAGEIRWGALFAVLPFGNHLVTMDLTGAQLITALEQQFQSDVHMLQVSGLTFTWDAARPRGSRVVDVVVKGAPIAKEARYRVVVNNYLADGGSGFLVFREGTSRAAGPLDRDALTNYIVAKKGAITAAIEGRIQRR
jgi:5'-nucleotidase